MLTIFSLGLVALAVVVFVPQTLGYYVSLYEERGKKIKRTKYWDEDNWCYGFFTIFTLGMVFSLIPMLGILMCLIFGIKPI